MAVIEVSLPDKLAEEATRAGLLSSERVELWVRAQLKEQHTRELFSAMDLMRAISEPATLSPEEVSRELAAMRAERKSSQNR